MLVTCPVRAGRLEQDAGQRAKTRMAERVGEGWKVKRERGEWQKRETKGEKRGGGVNSCSVGFSEEFVARGCRQSGAGADLAVGLGLRPQRIPGEGVWGVGHSEGRLRAAQPGGMPAPWEQTQCPLGRAQTVAGLAC